MMSIPPPPCPPPTFPEKPQKSTTTFQLVLSTLDTAKREIVLELEHALKSFQSLTGLKHCAYVHYKMHVDPVKQIGPTCGLVAVSMAAQLCHLPSVPDPDKLLEQARNLGYTKNGEMFCVEWMCDLIKNTFLTETKVVATSHQTIIEEALMGHPILIPYDSNNKNFGPVLEKGHSAHWAIVCGFAFVLEISQEKYVVENEEDGSIVFLSTEINENKLNFIKTSSIKTYVLCRQGKSSRIMVWELDQLIASNNNLLEVNPDRNDSNNFAIPVKGIANTLRNKIIVFNPRNNIH